MTNASEMKFCPFRGQFFPCSKDCGMYDDGNSRCSFVSLAENTENLNDKTRWIYDELARVARAIRDCE